MKIAIIGGSNSVLNHSYTNKLKQNDYNIKNYGIGATNSIYGIIQLIKNDIINQYDLIIYEYFVNDNNHFFQNVNNVDRVEKTLIEITNMCINSNTKLLFIYIYNKDDKISNRYSNSPMYLLYKNFSKNYNITTIDTFELLYSKFQEKWEKYYHDQTHLSDEGMNVLYYEIKDKLKITTVPKVISDNNYNGFKLLKLISISKYYNTINYTNSLINVDYLEILDEIKIKFNKKTTILAIEYLCDIDSGYIQLSNSKNAVQKNLLKDETFVRAKNKKMASLITMNKKLLEDDDYLVIKNIKYIEVDNNIYDREKITHEDKSNKTTSLKIISILVSDNASIINI
tara:strand:+ start:48 stop:1070 length:1023 start_codon:yes stop_codon:yes gene_type:complete